MRADGFDARLVATRFDDQPGPLRLCYLSHAYRAVTPQRGQQREFLQAGLELIGADAPGGTIYRRRVAGATMTHGSRSV